MTRYHIDEAVLDLPDDRHIDDRSTNHLALAPGDGPELDLVIERAAMAPREAEPVGDLPGIVVAMRWRIGDQARFASEAHVAVGARHVAFIATSALEQREACAAWASHVIASLRFRGVGA